MNIVIFILACLIFGSIYAFFAVKIALFWDKHISKPYLFLKKWFVRYWALIGLGVWNLFFYGTFAVISLLMLVLGGVYILTPLVNFLLTFFGFSPISGEPLY